MELEQRLDQTVDFLKTKIPNLNVPLAITLGSGLSRFATLLDKRVTVPFAQIPNFAPPTIEGHGGNFVFGYLGKTPVILLQGRVHYYEGHDWAQVVFPTRTLARLKVKNILLTNACGGLDPQMKPGHMMVITDHINLTGGNPLRGPNADFLGPRFPDMTNLYDRELSSVLRSCLSQAGAPFVDGVYCGVIGPSYETAAEVRYLRQIGGSGVGMSTVAEAIAARHAGMKVAGLSCVTNLATGISKTELSHQEVTEVAKQAEKYFSQALIHFIGSFNSEPAK